MISGRVELTVLSLFLSVREIETQTINGKKRLILCNSSIISSIVPFALLSLHIVQLNDKLLELVHFVDVVVFASPMPHILGCRSKN